MCLSYISEIKTATKNIVCYKVISHKKGGRGWVTPFQRVPIKIGEEYRSEISTALGTVTKALHSFKTEKGARPVLNNLKQNDFGIDTTGYSHRIVRCIIPKGSTYFSGVFGGCDPCDIPSYASNKIRYIEIVKLTRGKKKES